MNRWTVGWILWLALFLAIEIPAAFHHGATLSEHLWRWFSWPYGWLVLLGGLGYLTWHLVRGAWQRGQR